MTKLPKHPLPAYGRVIRLAAAQAAAAVAALDDAQAWDDQHVHQLRLLCKRLRAAVHLGRGIIDKDVRKHWNERLATAARALARARDGAILRGWMLEATSDAPANVRRSVPTQLARLARDYPADLTTSTRAGVLATLRAVANDWPRLWGNSRRMPADGIERMRQRTDAAGRLAREEDLVADWHRWRRMVKYLAYQLEWLALAGWVGPTRRPQRLRRLGRALGNLNDMHNLDAWLRHTRSRSQAALHLRAWTRHRIKEWKHKARTLR